jgi:putative DNA primase/helicase
MEILSQFIPQALMDLPQWVCWKNLPGADGKARKVPICPRNLRTASSTDRATWSTFDDAIKAAEGHPTKIDGIGFVFTPDDPFCGIDLDGCVDANGEISPEADRIITLLDSFTELSQSGRGLHVIIRGHKPPNTPCKSAKIAGCKLLEIYDQARYFIVTGRHLEGTPAAIEDRQDALLALLAEISPPKATPPSQTPLHRRAKAYLTRASQTSGTICEGQGRNNTAFTLSGHVHSLTDGATGQQLSPDEVLQLMQDWNAATCSPPLSAQELAEAVRNGCTRGTPREPKPSKPAPTPAPHATGPHDDTIPLGQTDPATGRVVLSPKRTLPTAEAYLQAHHTHTDATGATARTLRCHGGILWGWQTNRYINLEDNYVRGRLLPWLHRALRYVFNRSTQTLELTNFEANPGTVQAALESLRNLTHLPITLSAPAWIEDFPDAPPANELLIGRSRITHLPTMTDYPPTPLLFATNALDFDYDPAAPDPQHWLKFLNDLWGDDKQSIDLLQEWIGYQLIADTRQQKMLLLVGPRRSGKGTIARILTRLVGAPNVAGPTTSSLAGDFGLQPLIGKTVAIVSDARFSGNDIAIVVERLLCISGEDMLTVDRKHLDSVTMKLNTRFTFLSNEIPRFTDASGALAGRFLILQLTESFYNREDHGLEARLCTELPGILRWAVDGLLRLSARGFFIQPDRSTESLREMEDLSSPVAAFVRDRCEVGPGLRVDVDDLYAAWRAWCEQEGHKFISTKTTFGRDLRAAFPSIVTRQNYTRFYDGIALTS